MDRRGAAPTPRSSHVQSLRGASWELRARLLAPLQPSPGLPARLAGQGHWATLGDLRASYGWTPQDTGHPDGCFDACRPLQWGGGRDAPTTTSLPPLRRTEGTFFSPRWKPQFSFWGCGLEII